MSTYVVLVADTDIDAHGNADPDVRGPFPSQEAAEHYAVHIDRYNVQVLPILDPTLLQDGMVTEHEPWCNHDPGRAGRGHGDAVRVRRTGHPTSSL